MKSDNKKPELLGQKVLDNISMAHLEFKDSKLSEDDLKILVGSRYNFDFKRLKVEVYSPEKSFFLPSVPMNYLNLTSPIQASLSYRQFFAEKLTKKHINFYKTAGKSLEEELNRLKKRVKQNIDTV